LCLIRVFAGWIRAERQWPDRQVRQFLVAGGRLHEHARELLPWHNFGT